ncbi:hypothetical protein DDE19_34495 [Micromonospora ureilytica]|uniref:PknH-like extracellular domain-containing protein n=1 Tax=Micromonospora ureilytica TaxID=709868 RepID=A0A3N9X6N5_9ACTN|nr:hypothetical protein [Micromonospora ureilytica]RQX08711.1 hypothetical protein DDE19_34495 [Micromonospora ureilytica]WSG31226.1 hypothetical protein OHB55_26990 [Micromonospora ureilytica]
MRDEPTFVEHVRRDLLDVRWPEPQEIRARARRRSQRKIVVAAVVLALAGFSAVAVAAPRTSPPLVQPAAAPTRHEITTDALLQPADLPEPVYVQLSQAGLGEPVWLDDTLGRCRTSQGQSDGWQMSILSRSQTLMRKATQGVLVPGDALVMQDLFRLEPETARQLFTSLDDLVAPCTEWRSVSQLETVDSTHTVEVIHRWAVVQRGFAGHDAAILRDTFTAARDVQTGQTFGNAPPPTLLAVVRVGDTVSLLRIAVDGTEAKLRQLAVAAAARMCAAANPAC